MGTCCNCRQQRSGRLIQKRCDTCYRYWKRTGRERDIDTIVRTSAARLEREQASPYLIRLAYQRIRGLTAAP